MSARNLLLYGGLLLSLATACQSEPPRNANNTASLAATPSVLNSATPAPTPAPVASVPSLNATPATPAPTMTPNASAQNDYLITPGRSIGKIALDMPRSQVHELLGKPLTTSALNGVQVDTWGTTGGDDFAQVYYRADKAAQIEVAASKFVTANGLSTKSTLAQVQKALPKAKQTLRRTSGEGESNEMRYLDDAQSGVTFAFAQNTGFTVMVHRTGENAILNLEN